MTKNIFKEVSPRQKRNIKKHIFVYSMLAISIINFLIFYVYVNLDSFLLAFQDQATGDFSLDNFTLFFSDLSRGPNSEILINLKNTLYYYFLGLAGNFVSFIFAYFLYKKIFLHQVFKFVFMLPMIINGVAFAAIYTQMLSNNGIVTRIWENFFNESAPNFLFSFDHATPAILCFCLWTSLGGNLILFSGAMSRIPTSVIEYGRIDGVSEWREMWQIVLPLIAPTFGTIMILSCIGVFGASGPILLFTKGMWGTSTISYWMYEYVIVNQRYNYAAAFGLILSVCSLPFFFLCNWLTKKLPQDIEF